LCAGLPLRLLGLGPRPRFSVLRGLALAFIFKRGWREDLSCDAKMSAVTHFRRCCVEKESDRFSMEVHFGFFSGRCSRTVMNFDFLIF
jgi:hypothetical protein